MRKNLPKSILIIIALAFILRLLIGVWIFYSFDQDVILASDSNAFVEVATNILEGNGLSVGREAPYEPYGNFPPVYMLLIATSLFVGKSLIPIIILQIILASLIPLIVYKITKHITENKTIPIVAAAISAFEPLTIVFSFVILTSIVTTFFLLLAVYFLIRYHATRNFSSAGLSGGFLALSALTHPHPKFLFPIAILFFIYLLIYNWWKNHQLQKRVLGALFAFVLIFIAVMSPWMIRNYLHFGTTSTSATGLRNIYTDIAVSVETYRTGLSYDETETNLNKKFAEKYNVSESDINTPALGKSLAKEGLRIIFNSPKELFLVGLITVNSFFTQDLYMYYLDSYDLIPKFIIDFSPSELLLKKGPVVLLKTVWERMGIYALIPFVGRITWVTISLLSFWGAFLVLRKKSGHQLTAAIIVGGVIIYYALTSLVAGYSAYGYHRYPSSPYFFILTSIAIVPLFNMIRRYIRKTN